MIKGCPIMYSSDHIQINAIKKNEEKKTMCNNFWNNVKTCIHF